MNKVFLQHDYPLLFSSFKYIISLTIFLSINKVSLQHDYPPPTMFLFVNNVSLHKKCFSPLTRFLPSRERSSVCQLAILPDLKCIFATPLWSKPVYRSTEPFEAGNFYEQMAKLNWQ